MRNSRLGMVHKLELVHTDLADPDSSDPEAKGLPLTKLTERRGGMVALKSCSILWTLSGSHLRDPSCGPWGEAKKNPLKPNLWISLACCCHGDPWGQLRAQRNCPLIWGRCILIGQITRLSLIVVFNLHYWRESNGQTLGVSSPPYQEMNASLGGPIEHPVALFPVSSTISILG